MPETPTTPGLLRLGRLRLDPALRDLRADSVVTATVVAPDSSSEPQDAWSTAWADATRQARGLGADAATAQALAAEAGDPLAAGVRDADNTRVVVAAQGTAVLARWLPAGAAAGSVRVGPQPRLRDAAVAAARRPAYVVLLVRRDGAAVIAHSEGGVRPARVYPIGLRPGLQPDADPTRPPAQYHGERHRTDREPRDGGERNDAYLAARVAEAAAEVGAHIVLGAGEQPVLDAVAAHLAPSLGPVTPVGGSPAALDSDAGLSARIGAALDGLTAEAADAVAGRVAASAQRPQPLAVRGIADVTGQLDQRQVAVLLVAAGDDVEPLVWSALRQDAIVAALPEQSGPLAGERAAALLRRGSAA